MATINVDVQIGQVKAALDKIKASGADMRPVLDVIGSRLQNRIRMGFRLGRSPAGTPWLPLKLRTGQPLRDTGRLQNSITYKVTDDAVEVGTNLTSTWHGITHSIGRVHQFGAVVRPRWAPRLVFKHPDTGKTITSMKSVIPARPFMPIDQAGNLDLPPAWTKSVLDALTKHLLPGA